MTAAEAALWQALRARRVDGLKFKRQVPIGPFIVDFLCSARLAVEVDGRTHDDPERRRRDEARAAWLTVQGFRLVRFSDEQVIGGLPLVCAAIAEAARANAR